MLINLNKIFNKVKGKNEWKQGGNIANQELFIAGIKFYLWQVANNLNILLSNF